MNARIDVSVCFPNQSLFVLGFVLFLLLLRRACSLR
jgi:hypothetical protein